MPRKKNKPSRKEHEWAKQSQQGISWKAIVAILGSITFLVSAIVSGLDFINYLREGYQQFLWLGFAILGMVWLIVLWLLFKQRNAYGILWLAVTILAGVVVWNVWHSYIQTREDKLIVLIAKFDGPEEVYGLRNEILEKLNEDFVNDNDVEIVSINEVVTPDHDSGTSRAVKLGQSFQADIVIWGWYRPTENPNITMHIENLSTSEITTIKENETYQPQATLAQLESFEIQRQLGSETSTLVSFLTGLLRFESGNYQTARERFEKILMQNDISTYISRSDLYFLIGYSKVEEGDFEGAIQNYNQGIAINPGIPSVYINRGWAYFELEQYERAIQDFDKVIAIDPKYARGYYNRGVAYYKLEQYERAIQDFDKAIVIDPKYIFAYHDRGAAYNELEQYERAIQDFDKVIVINPEYASAYTNRGFAYNELEQYEQAIHDFDKAIAINPKYARAYNNRGAAYNDLEQYKQAISDFDIAIAIDPKYAFAYYNRGVAYYKLEQYERAIQDFDEAIVIDPKDALTHYNRGWGYYKLKQYDFAIQDFDKAIELKPQYADSYYVRGLAYASLGKTVEAETDFKKYKELTSQKP